MNKILKTATGLAVVVLGAAFQAWVPVIGPIAGPYIMSIGGGIVSWGVIDKAIRNSRGEDAFSKEREIVKNIKERVKR